MGLLYVNMDNRLILNIERCFDDFGLPELDWSAYLIRTDYGV